MTTIVVKKEREGCKIFPLKRQKNTDQGELVPPGIRFFSGKGGRVPLMSPFCALSVLHRYARDGRGLAAEKDAGQISPMIYGVWKPLFLPVLCSGFKGKPR